MTKCDVSVIGAGPYGLSAAAHLMAVNGLNVHVSGEPMSFWERHMPVGMLLRSPWAGSHLSDPNGALTLDAYRKATPGGFGSPIPLNRFVDYGLWFQHQTVPEVLDVLEHLEDYFSFLRELKPRSRYKLFHIPLEISVQGVLRGKIFLRNRELHGHLHYFTKETALHTLEDVGYEVLDYSFSPEYEMPTTVLQTKLMKLPRRLFFALNKDWAIRVLGGSRILVLAQ